jgi:hypothetical protein
MEIWNTFLHPDLSNARHAAHPLRQIQLLGAAVDIHHDHRKSDVLLPILLVIPSCNGSDVPLPSRPGNSRTLSGVGAGLDPARLASQLPEPTSPTPDSTPDSTEVQPFGGRERRGKVEGSAATHGEVEGSEKSGDRQSRSGAGRGNGEPEESEWHWHRRARDRV